MNSIKMPFGQWKAGCKLVECCYKPKWQMNKQQKQRFDGIHFFSYPWGGPGVNFSTKKKVR